jgi:hypothetical protein
MALTKVSRGLLSTGIVDNSNATAITLNADESATFAGNVGIGGVNTSFKLYVGKSGGGDIAAFTDTSSADLLINCSSGVTRISPSTGILALGTGNVEKIRIDSSGNLLVGKTTTALGTAGLTFGGAGFASLTRSGAEALNINRLSSDGALAVFYKDGTTVGSIDATGGNININSASTGMLSTIGTRRLNWDSDQLYPQVDNTYNLGHPSFRYDDIYATNGTIQPSDRNEKQDIAELSDAEQRVAVACKGLLRKFRWKDSVAEKGDDARIHFGIIAQDLQAAFEAEGLDAGRYAMFMSNTWWETQTEVAAVEATEDTEAVDAYTRTDTYDTAEEAPEGATERTRLGVRYSELLAFIISAI